NGLSLVNPGTNLSDYLTISGLWVFLALSFFLFELYRRWTRFRAAREASQTSTSNAIKHFSFWHTIGYMLVCGVVLVGIAFLGLRALLVVLLGLGVFLCIVSWKEEKTVSRFMYLMLLMGLYIG